MEPRTRDRVDEDQDKQIPMYHFEHMTAYVLAVVAIAFGAIGLLRGFGIIGGDGVVFDNSFITGEKWDALLWLVPAVTMALLSFALHASDHHMMRDPDTLEDAHKGMWNGEHFLAWVVAVGAIGLSLVGMLVGFNVLSDENRYSQFDGLLWTLAGLGAGVLTNTLHSVRHHQLASDQDYIIAAVESRVRDRDVTRGTPARATEVERRR